MVIKLLTTPGFYFLIVFVVTLPFWMIFSFIINRIGTKILRKRTSGVQTPVIFYRHPKTGRRIVFICVLHIGESEYYKHLQALINDHPDHKVLYEGVGSFEKIDEATLNDAEKQVRNNFVELRELLRWATKTFSLTHQHEGLEYPSSWIRTDMCAKEIVQLTVANEADFISINLNTEEIIEDDVERSFVTWVLCKAFNQIVTLSLIGKFTSKLSKKSRASKRIILDMRNQIAMTGVNEHSIDDDVLTIWGAEHFHGMSKMIHKAGFREVRKIWFTAYGKLQYSFLQLFKDCWAAADKEIEDTQEEA